MNTKKFQRKLKITRFFGPWLFAFALTLSFLLYPELFCSIAKLITHYTKILLITQSICSLLKNFAHCWLACFSGYYLFIIKVIIWIYLRKNHWLESQPTPLTCLVHVPGTTSMHAKVHRPCHQMVWMCKDLKNHTKGSIVASMLCRRALKPKKRAEGAITAPSRYQYLVHGTRYQYMVAGTRYCIWDQDPDPGSINYPCPV